MGLPNGGGGDDDDVEDEENENNNLPMPHLLSTSPDSTTTPSRSPAPPSSPRYLIHLREVQPLPIQLIGT